MPEQLRALVRLPYGNKAFLPGEKFTASPFDAKVLVMTGRAARVEDIEPELPAIQEQEIQTRDLEEIVRGDPAWKAAGDAMDRDFLTASMQAQPVEKPKRGRPRKSQYDRRDMQAED